MGQDSPESPDILLLKTLKLPGMWLNLNVLILFRLVTETELRATSLGLFFFLQGLLFIQVKITGQPKILNILSMNIYFSTGLSSLLLLPTVARNTWFLSLFFCATEALLSTPWNYLTTPTSCCIVWTVLYGQSTDLETRSSNLNSTSVLII